MIYLRGLEKEYDMWKEETGCNGWGWDDVSSLFKKSEKALGDGIEEVDQEVHGTTGMCFVYIGVRECFFNILRFHRRMV
jgi:choline dehydrogenase-like flavoprotein